MNVNYRFYDAYDGELIADIALGTYEVYSTTVDINSTHAGFGGSRVPDNITINYVIRRGKP